MGDAMLKFMDWMLAKFAWPFMGAVFFYMVAQAIRTVLEVRG